MIEQHGIYTLIGSKPITLFSTIPLIDEHEKTILYQLQEESFKKHVSLKKYAPKREDALQLWKDWKAVEKKLVGSQFFFAEGDELGSIFVNIPSAVFILNKYLCKIKLL